MKINEKDIDPGIINKINRLDKVVNSFSDENKSGFLTYNGTEFTIKKINDLSLRKIINYSDLLKFEKYLYKNDSLYASSFSNNFNLHNRANSKFRTQVVSLNGIEIFSIDNPIRISKREKNNFLVLDTEGIFYKFDIATRKLDFSLNIIERVKSLFAIEKLLPYDVLTFEVYRTGFLFSTRHNGVFYADIENNQLEVVFIEDHVTLIQDSGDGNVLLLSEGGIITIYNFDNRVKLETINILKKLDQYPFRSTEENNDIFILGKHKYTNSNKNILHILKRDLANLGYSDISSLIYPGTENYDYDIFDLIIDGDSLYIVGLKNKQLFFWKYSLANLSKEYQEVIFTAFEIEKLSFVKIKNGEIYFSYDNKLIVIDETGKIIKNFKLKSERIDDIVFLENNKELMVFSEKSAVLYSISDYFPEAETTLSCTIGKDFNVTEIFSKSTNGKEKLVLVNGDTLEQIIPSVYLSFKEYTFIRILGSNFTNLIIKISIPEDTEIDGIIVYKDRIFLK